VKVYGVDEKTASKIGEGGVADETGNECFEWFTTVERGSEKPPECDIGAGDLEHIPPADQTSPGIHLPHRYSRCPRAGNQGSDAGSNDQTGNQTTFLEGPEHTYVGQPF
jgi:hypothetical protein